MFDIKSPSSRQSTHSQRTESSKSYTNSPNKSLIHKRTNSTTHFSREDFFHNQSQHTEINRSSFFRNSIRKNHNRLNESRTSKYMEDKKLEELINSRISHYQKDRETLLTQLLSPDSSHVNSEERKAPISHLNQGKRFTTTLGLKSLLKMDINPKKLITEKVMKLKDKIGIVNKSQEVKFNKRLDPLKSLSTFVDVKELIREVSKTINEEETQIKDTKAMYIVNSEPDDKNAEDANLQPKLLTLDEFYKAHKKIVSPIVKKNSFESPGIPVRKKSEALNRLGSFTSKSQANPGELLPIMEMKDFKVFNTLKLHLDESSKCAIKSIPEETARGDIDFDLEKYFVEDPYPQSEPEKDDPSPKQSLKKSFRIITKEMNEEEEARLEKERKRLKELEKLQEELKNHTIEIQERVFNHFKHRTNRIIKLLKNKTERIHENTITAVNSEIIKEKLNGIIKKNNKKISQSTSNLRDSQSPPMRISDKGLSPIKTYRNFKPRNNKTINDMEDNVDKVPYPSKGSIPTITENQLLGAIQETPQRIYLKNHYSLKKPRRLDFQDERNTTLTSFSKSKSSFNLPERKRNQSLHMQLSGYNSFIRDLCGQIDDLSKHNKELNKTLKESVVESEQYYQEKSVVLNPDPVPESLQSTDKVYHIPRNILISRLSHKTRKRLIF